MFGLKKVFRLMQPEENVMPLKTAIGHGWEGVTGAEVVFACSACFSRGEGVVTKISGSPAVLCGRCDTWNVKEY